MNALGLILDLHAADAEPVIGGRVWHRVLDDKWEFWVSGMLGPAKCDGNTNIDPGDCYVKFNGWPAGVISMFTGEGCIAAGSMANIETFCEALRKAAVK
jgi:hypothetical protein